MWRNKWIGIALICSILSVADFQATAFDVKNIVPGKIYQSQPRNGYERLSIYCYNGVSKHILHFWQTVRLQVNIEGSDWVTYLGHTSEDVLREYDAQRSSWSIGLPFWQKTEALFLNPFNGSCVGVSTAQDFSIFLHVIRVDFWRVLMFAGGCLLYFSAPKLSSNPIFYYSCGVSLGVSTSFLILVYFLSKLIPRRPAMFGFLAGGWAIGAYLAQLVFANLRTIAQLYQHYVLAYFTLAGLLSFAICYRYGPVTNPRTESLIRWALQGTGLALMFFSSQFSEAAMAVLVLILVGKNFPRSWISAVFNLWRSKFPPKQKLLTEDEYHEEGARETVKALENLRQYCSSPECNQWKTVLRLQSPIRFAEFIEGKSHLSDAELLEYESDVSKPDFETDDSD